ncbi:MAG TPA: hypothetical protein VFG62_12165 [Rhodopila sp.]|nr:hypothetical protein [Rhodopila sp.]
MGQIMQFSAPPPDYPETTDALDLSERVFLLAVRWWVAAQQRGRDPLSHMRVTLDSIGAEAAALPLNRFMTVASHSTSRRVVTYCPCSPHVGTDEKHLLYPASLVQKGEIELAARVLQTTILTEEGAVLALGPLEEIGERLARARLLFRLRQAPSAESTFPPTVESWISALSGTTLH